MSDQVFDIDLKPTPIDNSILQDIIGSTVAQIENSTNSSDPKNDQDLQAKTSEDDSNADQTNSNKSRELKLLLALSKQANLNTNISRKRKTLDGNKVRDHSPKSNPLHTDIKKPAKLANESRNKYPVTAESELELEIQETSLRNLSENANKVAKRKRDGSLSEISAGGATEETKKNRKSLSTEIVMFKTNKDTFCWRCHRDGVNITCQTCPRSYHQRCLKQTLTNTAHWPCPECVSILKAESTQTRSEAMKGMTLEHLCGLLKFAVTRMIQCQGEPFLHPVSDVEFPTYKKYIVQPMDLTKLEKNIKDNLYGSTQAFEADAKWLLHNSIIFNSYQSKLTTVAKNIVRICKQEMSEIENCPSCYLNANTKVASWFVEVCPKPHLLVWAKLKGFPYWPAKMMSANPAGMVDVRFFGAHDRAWVHYKECFLYSEKDPNTFKQKRYDIEQCVEESNIYIANLTKTFGEFRYAPFRTPLDPNNETKQLQIFLPRYKSYMSPRKRLQLKHDYEESKKELKDVQEEKKAKSELLEGKPDDSLDEKKPCPDEEISTPKKPSDTMEKEDAKPKSPESKTSVVRNSVVQDIENDFAMEGYGTDDDTKSEIDLDRRKTLRDGTMGSVENDKVDDDEEEDNDTQVPSNIKVDSSVSRSSVRTRGGFNNFTGKLKILPRRSSEADNSQKRISTEDAALSPLKISRRNSDQSVRSDSSRMSSVSDKINRVNISEFMEVTLGNDDIGCVSISENISSSNSESSESSTESSIDNKRKPVQVDIENAEFTISPSSKLKIADKLMKRLSDGEENGVASKADDVKKVLLLEKKSPTDTLVEKLKGVGEKEVTEFTQPSTSSGKEAIEKTPANSEKVIVETKSPTDTLTQKLKGALQKEISNSNQQSTSSKEIAVNGDTDDTATAEILGQNEKTEENIDKSDRNKADVGDKAEKVVDENEASSRNKKSTDKDETADGFIVNNKETGGESERSVQLAVKSNAGVSDGVKSAAGLAKPETKIRAMSSTSERSISIEEIIGVATDQNSDTDKSKPVKDTRSDDNNIVGVKEIETDEVSLENNNEQVQKTEVDSTKSNGKKSNEEPGNKDELSEGVNFPETKQTPKKQRVFIQPSITQFTTKLNETADNGTVTENIPRLSEPSPSARKKDSNKSKHVPDVVMNIIEEFETNEEMDVADDIQIDKNNIFNVIHSSLNAPVEPEPRKPDASSGNKKRKLRSDENPNPQAKLVKLVPIEKILNKPESKEKENGDSASLLKSLQGKKMIRKPSSTNTTPTSSVSRQSSVQEIIPEEIKSEPETDDDFSESENIEAKRKYLSALNISEKTGDAERQANEIRTRSKTEEKRERFKVVDNLTRIIDDVALNYSAANEGKDMPSKKPQRRRGSVSPAHEGEIFVKSFAKMQAPKQRARKSFPVPPYEKSPQISLLKSSSPNIASKKEAPKFSINVVATTAQSTATTKITSSTPSPSKNLAPKTVEPVSSTVSHVILLPPNQTINYNGALINPVLNVIPPPLTTTTTTSTTASATQPAATAGTLKKVPCPPPNLRASQNYIPQNEDKNKGPSEPPNLNDILLSELLNQSVAASVPAETEQTESAAPENNENNNTEAAEPEDEFSVLNSLVPDNVSKAVSELLLRPPPRLRPRPPGMLSQVFNEGMPSGAGDVTARINSVAHRLGDYFRGMLIETLDDLGKSPNPEAKIVGLQLELESIKHRHNVELSEMRKNVCTILKDIQKSIVEDREKTIDETRSSCEAEAIKRIELAKSKQWCASCSKEAQFYCCWNTSYCDYPCQQKHWPQHLGKCTQAIEKTNETSSTPIRPSGQQLILRPAVPPKSGVGRIVAKPTKVYLNRASCPPKTFKAVTSTANHVTSYVIETTPGNYEYIGNGPIAVTSKLTPATTTNIFHSKVKATNVVTATSPASTNATSSQRNQQKTTSVSDSVRSPSAVDNNTRTSLPHMTVLGDDSD